ncbi:uncharacterized protein PRCAT00002316001 [Priceomyces carsonii]|uniref:uncharacterized protein n=1 Tax=Priceomyces carsonii TaxID=28549 RepID=UPI002ED928C5|nr:unnamed protein product [Priceomyces carsonii]
MEKVGPEEEKDNVPGTIHLVDVEGFLNVEKKEGSGNNIILHPKPSSNPNDPLRWPKVKKNFQFVLLITWAFMQSVSTVWMGPVYDIWTVEFDCTYLQLNNSAGILFACIAIGCVTLQPLALKFGKRIVYLICTLLEIVGNALYLHGTIGSLYGASAIVGFASSPMFSLIEISSIDIFFQHERADKVSYVVFALYGGVALGPLAAGFITEGAGWKWSPYILIIIFGTLFFLQLFLMEDTTFERDDESEELETNILHQIKSHETLMSGNIQEEKSKITKDQVALKVMKSVDSSIPERTYMQRMHLIETEYSDKRGWAIVFFKPFLLCSLPAVVWCGILQSIQQMWLTFLLNTQSLFFALPPYNFSTGMVGVTNLATFVGTILGMFYGGSLVDIMTIFLAKRNNGILEPEFRLWNTFIPLLINGGGLLAYGLGISYGAPWGIPVCIGQGCLGFSMASMTGIAYTYCSDCYPNLVDESVVMISFINNGLATVFTFFISEWMDRDGINLMTYLMFMISLVLNGSCFIFIFFGKKFRRLTKNNYYRISDLGKVTK